MDLLDHHVGVGVICPFLCFRGWEQKTPGGNVQLACNSQQKQSLCVAPGWERASHDLWVRPSFKGASLNSCPALSLVMGMLGSLAKDVSQAHDVLGHS